MLSTLNHLGRSLFPRGTLIENIEDFDRPLQGAVDWIRHAHALGNGGISKGYDTLRARWDRPYPETTGYTIPTLLNLASEQHDADLRSLALNLAEFLIVSQGKEGGVSHWASEQPNPIVFDTGQVLFGFLAAYKATQKAVFLEAATKCGDWLCRIQDPGGSWKKGQHLGVEKVIDTRVAWALLRLQLETGENKYRTAAIRCLDWAKTRQNEDGWFNQCSFTPTEDPFTHTLAYTAEGFLESSKLLSDDRYLETARRTADALLNAQQADGRLCSTFSSGWKESSHSSCLTGNCQSAKLWLDIFELDGDSRYFSAAQLSLGFVVSRQTLNQDLPGIHGGIPGSAPFYGIYERFKYPNWAAKFFIDAVMAMKRIHACRASYPFVG